MANILGRLAVIDAIHESTNYNKKDIAAILDAQDAVISGALKAGQEPAIGKSGRLIAVHRPARTARNPKSGDPIDVPAKTTAKFKTGKGLIEALA